MEIEELETEGKQHHYQTQERQFTIMKLDDMEACQTIATPKNINEETYRIKTFFGRSGMI